MRYRRPDSNREPGVTVIGVRISRSIWCRTLPPNRGRGLTARRGAPAVLLTAITVQVIHRIDRHQVPVDEFLDIPRADHRRLSHAYTPVLVRTLASTHANTSDRL